MNKKKNRKEKDKANEAEKFKLADETLKKQDRLMKIAKLREHTRLKRMDKAKKRMARHEKNI